jgi:UDP-N-acetylmuramate dehydrogenase
LEKGDFVLCARFALNPDDPAKIREREEELLFRRRDKQPLEFGSAGSTFKRPEGYFAGKLIEDAGLKGLSVGEAQVSEKHAGFIINRGTATCSDVLELIKIVKARVFDAFGVVLEPEVRYLGTMGEERF